MIDYDFRILQPSEFECFSRDLLQAREKIFIESFADGRDKGIDLRFAYNKEKTCIVQCKRYKEWGELKNKLKEEVKKVKKLNPQRYILTTSVELSVSQKDEIIKMFSPFILNSTDVLGRKDLNNLLEQHQDIERNYHKLWLASTNVLNMIVNSATLNWSAFELEKIEKDIRLYVDNKSLEKALYKLKENHYVIISGIPGIGKTTLARMLVYNMLANGYEEFVYVDQIDAVAQMFNKEKRQVFFYDDFLGSNSFVPQSISFENKLITFIEKVKNNKHTLFILSTREYVLSEAKEYYEKLSMSNIDIAKCTIELEYYTKSIKAKILYNHLSEAKIPQEYIDIFLKKRSYLSIINHQNFNPRVIESIIKEQVWRAIDPKDFADKMISFFDNPISVWQFAFEKLDKDTRYALLVFGSMGGNVTMADFEEAYRTFCKLTNDEIGLKYDDIKWKQSLKVLMNCFIRVRKEKEGQTVKMFNPSVADFIVFYLSSNKNTAKMILQGAYFIEQLLYAFTDNKEYAAKKNLVHVDESMIPQMKESFNRIWEEYKSCKLKDRFWDDWEKEGFIETRILYDLKTRYPLFCKTQEGFAERLYDTDELSDQTIQITKRLQLMGLLDWNYMYPKADEYFQQILDNETLDADEWLVLVETIKDLGVERDVIGRYFYDKLDDDLEAEAERFTDVNECEELHTKVFSLSEMLPDWQSYNLTAAIMDVEKRIQEEEEESADDSESSYYKWRGEMEKEDSEIDEMFSALREN